MCTNKIKNRQHRRILVSKDTSRPSQNFTTIVKSRSDNRFERLLYT